MNNKEKRAYKGEKGKEALKKAYNDEGQFMAGKVINFTYDELNQALTHTALEIERINDVRRVLGESLLRIQQTQSRIWRDEKQNNNSG